MDFFEGLHFFGKINFLDSLFMNEKRDGGRPDLVDSVSWSHSCLQSRKSMTEMLKMHHLIAVDLTDYNKKILMDTMLCERSTGKEPKTVCQNIDTIQI